jgi:hypothetical protein
MGDFLNFVNNELIPYLKSFQEKTSAKYKTKAHLPNLQEQQPDKTCKRDKTAGRAAQNRPPHIGKH